MTAMTMLKIDGMKVRCEANKVFAIAHTTDARYTGLVVSKRTDSVEAVRAELRRIGRELPDRHAYVFSLKTGNLLTEKGPRNPDAPDRLTMILTRALTHEGMS